MEIIVMVLAAALMLAVAVYAQRQLENFTKGTWRIVTVRTVLAVVGFGFGFVSALNAEGDLLQALTFLSGFGVVHIPAAIILFIKRRRGSGKS